MGGQCAIERPTNKILILVKWMTNVMKIIWIVNNLRNILSRNTKKGYFEKTNYTFQMYLFPKILIFKKIVKINYKNLWKLYCIMLNLWLQKLKNRKYRLDAIEHNDIQTMYIA